MTPAEERFLGFLTRWGRDAYPVAKVGGAWRWIDFMAVPGPSTAYRTREEALAAIDAFLAVLRAERDPKP